MKIATLTICYDLKEIKKMNEEKEEIIQKLIKENKAGKDTQDI